VSLMRRWIGTAGLAVILAGCATSHFQTTWKNGAAQPVPMTGKKVLVVALNVPRFIRLGIENAMAEELRDEGVNGVPSFKVLDEQSTTAQAKAKALADGYDAAFVIRLADNEHDVIAGPSYAPRDQDRTFLGSEGVWASADLKSFTAYEKVWIETLVYSVREDQLAWSGVTTTDNANIGAKCREIARMAIVELKKQGLVL